MKTASATYKMVRALLNSWYEWRIIQGENVYGLDKIRSLAVSYSLTSGSGISIGNATSATCKMTLLEESVNWPRMARFTVQFRICLGASGTKSEWITFGVFYTDERSEDKLGNLYIIAFDGMLKMEQTWTDKIPDQLLPATYPITAKAWATMIQSASLATFDDITQLNDTLEFVGLDTTSSIRDVLKNIAAVHGGNWVITDTEKLKLVPFENVTSSQTSKYVDLGLSTQSFEDSPALDPVTGVYLETTSGVVMEAGDSTGYVVKANCDVSDTDGIAQLCYSKLEDYVFKPFQAITAYIDPIAEIGDSVSVDGTIYQIMSMDWVLNKMPSADVTAPYDQEIDHEYKTVSQEARIYRKTVSLVDGKMSDYVPWDEVSTAITQNADSVVLAAEGTFVTQAVYDAEIASIQSQLDGSIQTWSGNVVPTLNNAPAEDWTTPALKAEHVGDTYFVNSDAGIPEAGQYYRFENNNGTYSWQLLTDSALTEALAQAAAALAAAEDAQDAADAASAEAQSKGRIFVTQPTPPYDVGDLWFNSDQSVIKVCMTAKTSGGSFSDSDWVKRDKYTDDSALQNFLYDYNLTITALQNQVDKKAETYYQSTDPAVDWGIHPVGIAIAGVDVAGISNTISQQHEGDLWYRTTDKTTWYFNGTAWEQQNVPEEVFDKIDGKAQIFVSMPETYDEYNIGDLWVNATVGDTYSNDVLRCITPKAVGEYFNLSHWIKASKYTDDTALNQFKSEFTVQPNQIKAEVEKRVIKDQSSTMSSFGWLLNENSHTWYSDAQEVMKVNSSGLFVKGNITATSGYIGTASSGFEITASAIRNGMTSLTDTTHNGVYIGTNGIALGAGKFKVTSAGVITATSGTIGGFTITNSSIYNGMTSLSDTDHDGVYIGTDGIALGHGHFKVYDTGELEAWNGWFAGNVVASRILSAVDDPVYGYFDGHGLETYSVSGGVGGQIGYTGNGGLIGANMEYATITDAYTDSGINTSLGYANYAASVFSGITRANYLMASYVSAADQLIVGGYDVVWQYSSTLGGYVLMRSTA